MGEAQKKPWHQFSLTDLFVLTALAGIGIVVYQFGKAARPHAPLAVAVLAAGGTASTFVAYLIPSKKRVLWTTLLLIVYALAMVSL